MVREAANVVVSAGRAGRTRYALRRPLRGDAADVPVYAIDSSGNAELIAGLALVQPQGCRMILPRPSDWPLPSGARDGWWDGLPYPIYDMRPQGYMGRQLAHAEAERSRVPRNPAEWSDEDIVFMLTRFGKDASGNLILGDVAYQQWLKEKVAPEAPLADHEIAAAYAELAERAIDAGVPGSNAAGEFPKFSATRSLGGSMTPHVLVKFSGAGESATVRRWADLLLCEHHALECARDLQGIRSAANRIVQGGGRTFLEVERFDRLGQFGRGALCSLEAINAAFLGGNTSNWAVLGAQMAAARLLDPSVVSSIERLWWYGRLIANNDMHLGNLSFTPQGMFELAPTYDMLPMLYAPLAGGEVPAREFVPELPLPPPRAAWKTAGTAAAAFWLRAADDVLISAPFRATCRGNGEKLRKLAAVV